MHLKIHSFIQLKAISYSNFFRLEFDVLFRVLFQNRYHEPKNWMHYLVHYVVDDDDDGGDDDGGIHWMEY